MRKRETTVTLITKNGERAMEFETSHAERMLRIPNRAWELPSNSKFEFVNNGIRVKQDKGADTVATKRV